MEIKVTEGLVYIGDDSWSSFSKYKGNHGKFLLVIDGNVAKLHKDRIDTLFHQVNHRIINLPNPEELKSLEGINLLTNVALEYDLSRHDGVVAIGGGATGDLVGMFSGIYKRGISFYNFPTTLLSQVDSSIGGKTAINHGGIKNSLGLFHSAKAIYMDPSLLETLEYKEFISGLGEIVKYGLLQEKLLFYLLDNIDSLIMKNKKVLTEVIKECILLKNFYVENDYKDTDGMRIALNLGHTLGHLIEQKSPDYLSHGLSVAKGLDFAIFLSLKKQLISEDQYKIRKELLNNVLKEIPNFDLSNYTNEFTGISNDKKFTGGGIQFVLVTNQGHKVENMILEEFNNYIREFMELNK